MPKSLLFALAAVLLAQLQPNPAAALERITPAKIPSGTVPFTLDAGRILIEVGFRKPDGGLRRALAWFNMGMPSPTLTKALYRELQIDAGHTLRIETANAMLEAPASEVTNGDGGVAAPSFEHLFAPYPVEAMLPASILQDYAVTIDYPRRLFGLARGGAKIADGVAVPFELNDKTGFATVDVTVAGHDYPFVIDAGAGYSWMRGETLKRWLAQHPEWRRAEGAIGPANNNMLDYAFEKQGTIARLPTLAVGPVLVKDVGVLGTGPVFGSLIDGVFGDFFWDNWQKSASRPVVGWLGGNVLESFKLTIDFPNRVSYWRAQIAPDPHDLDQVGVTLVRREGRYFIGGLVREARESALDGIAVGDELIGVDSFDARGASKSAVLAALGGKAGDMRLLRLQRDGQTREVAAPVLDLR